MSLLYGALAAARHTGGASSARSTSTGMSPAVISLAKLLLVSLIHIPLTYAAPLFPRAIQILEEVDPEEDPTSLWAYLGTAIALVLLGGAFAGLTIALMGQDEIYLQVIATSGEGSERKNAGRVLRLLNKGKHWVLVTLLLSNVITNETLPIVLDRSLGGGWPAVVGSTVLIVIFGEIVPQSICVRYGLPIGAWMAPFVTGLMWLMAPIAWPTAKLLDWLLGEDHGTTYKKAGLKTLVTLHKTLGGTPGERLNEDEVTIISAVLDLKEKPVGDIMTPMNDVFTMSADTVLDEKMMDTILSQGYSRIPIYAPENPRNFIGMLLVKILITYDPEDCFRVRDFALATLPETAPDTSCLDIVNFFQEGKSHMVLVSDFPGQDRGALGVVTLEDVIEELIGEEIIDESDVFVDVHRAIRRIQPAPRTRYTDESEASKTDDQDANADADATESDRLLKTEPPQSRKSSLGGPREATFMMRRRSSNGSSKDRRPIAVRSKTADMKQHLRHLGPSNVASRPKSTKYTSVKIKPGVGTIPEVAEGSKNDVQSPERPRSISYTSSSMAPEGDVGTGLIHDAAGDAKDGAATLAASGYGTMSGDGPIKISSESAIENGIDAKDAPPPAQTAAEASAQAERNARHGGTEEAETADNEAPTEEAQREEPQRPDKLVVPSGHSRPASANGRSDSQSSNESTLGELENRRPSRVGRRAARSGSITENVVDVGGLKKVVLETTSSSDGEDGQKAADGDDNQNGGSTPDGDDAQGDGQQTDAGKKKKRKKRGGKKVREKEANKTSPSLT